MHLSLWPKERTNVIFCWCGRYALVNNRKRNRWSDGWNGLHSRRDSRQMIYLPSQHFSLTCMDAQRVQCSTRWPNSISMVRQPLYFSVPGNPHCLQGQLTELTLYLWYQDRNQDACCFILSNSWVAYDKDHIHPMDDRGEQGGVSDSSPNTWAFFPVGSVFVITLSFHFLGGSRSLYTATWWLFMCKKCKDTQYQIKCS